MKRKWQRHFQFRSSIGSLLPLHWECSIREPANAIIQKCSARFNHTSGNHCVKRMFALLDALLLNAPAIWLLEGWRLSELCTCRQQKTMPWSLSLKTWTHPCTLCPVHVYFNKTIPDTSELLLAQTPQCMLFLLFIYRLLDGSDGVEMQTAASWAIRKSWTLFSHDAAYTLVENLFVYNVFVEGHICVFSQIQDLT